MRIRKGRIERVETPPTSRQRTLKVHLSSGIDVYVPREILELLIDTGLDLKAEIAFIEKGILRRTAWLGTPDLLALGVELGAITAAEAEEAGWIRPQVMGREIRHPGGGRLMVVAPPDAGTRGIVDAVLRNPAIASHPISYFGLHDRPARPTETLRVAEMWVREPFAPFECTEEDWLFLSRLIEGVVVRSEISGLMGSS